MSQENQKVEPEEQLSDIEIQALTELINAFVTNSILTSLSEPDVYEIRGPTKADLEKVTTRIKAETEFPVEYRRLAMLILTYARLYSLISGDNIVSASQNLNTMTKNLRELISHSTLKSTLPSSIPEYSENWSTIYNLLTENLPTDYTKEQLEIQMRNIRTALSDLLNNFVMLIRIIFQYLDKDLIFRKLTGQGLKNIGISGDSELTSRDISPVNLLIESRLENIYSRQILYLQNPTPAISKSVDEKIKTDRYFFDSVILEIDTEKINDVITEAYNNLESSSPKVFGGGEMSSQSSDPTVKKIKVPGHEYTLSSTVHAIKMWFDNIEQLKSRVDLIKPYLESKKYDEALKQFEIEKENNPQFADVWYSSIGYCYMKKKVYDEAIVAFRRSLDENPNQVYVLKNLGLALGNLRRYEEAIQYFDKAIEIDPNHVDAWNNKGLALANLGRHQEAIQYIDKAIEIRPDYAYAWYNKGTVLDNLGRHEEAIKDYDKAIEIDPKYARAWNNKGLALANLGRHQEAIEHYDKAIEIRPDYAYAWYNKGTVLDNLGRHEEAIKDYDKAIEITPDYAYAWNNKGVALANLGRHQEAIEHYDKAIEIDPNHVDAWNNKGLALANLGRHQEAIKDYDKAIEIDPKYARAWNNKGLALANLGRHQEAIQHYDKAIEIDPNHVDAWNNKGLALSNLGRHQEAIQYIDKAIEIRPDYAYAWYNKGTVLDNLGRHEEAIKDYDKAIELDPKFARAKGSRSKPKRRSVGSK